MSLDVREGHVERHFQGADGALNLREKEPALQRSQGRRRQLLRFGRSAQLTVGAHSRKARDKQVSPTREPFCNRSAGSWRLSQLADKRAERATTRTVHTARLRHQGVLRDGIWFNRTEPLAERVRVAYRLSLDEWNGQQRIQMVVETACAA